MSEDEAIKILKHVNIVRKFSGIYSTTETIHEAIETILDLYQKEKEKNKELEENQNRLAFKTNQYMNEVLSNNIINKDKIRAKIKELENQLKKIYDDEDKEGRIDISDLFALKTRLRVYKELLEEE